MHLRQKFVSGLFLLSLVLGAVLYGVRTQQVKADTATVSATLSVTASVLAKPVDFQAVLASDATGTLEQDTVVTYSATYGSRLLYADDITVEAQWYAGLPDGSSPVDIFEYVPGSATVGYGSVSPVYDSVNKKISWTIHNIPSNTTDQTVSFQLKTNAAYTGGNTVALPVSVRVVSRTISTADSTVTESYKYHGSPVTESPTPTPEASTTPAPAASASPTPGVTPSPTTTTTTAATTPPSLASLQQSTPSLTLVSLIDTSLKFSVQTQDESSVQVNYGTNLTLQNSTESDGTFSTLHTVQLSNLLPNTNYYVQVIATNAAGEVTRSDVYLFKTALTSEQPQVQLPTLTFLTSNVTLFSQNQNLAGSIGATGVSAQQLPVINLPLNTLYSFHFASTKMQSIKKIIVFIRDARVLGATTGKQATANTLSTQLILNSNGAYEGNLITPTKPGRFEVFAQIFDVDGNIVETKIADLHVSYPLRVTDAKTKNGIEKAEVVLYYYDLKTKSYVILPPQLFAALNPDYTDVKGNLASLALPQGKYQARVSATKFKPKSVEFTIGSEVGQDYPEIVLEREPFNFLTMLKYFSEIFQDFAGKRIEHLQVVAQSSRFFELNILLTVSMMVFLTCISFSTRIRVPLEKLPKYLIHRTRILFLSKDITEVVKGVVIDKLTQLPISGADVFFIDERLKQIVAHKKTGLDGKFSFIKALSTLEAIEVMADGYEPFSLDADSYVCEESLEHVLELEKSTKQKQLWEDGLSWFEKFLGLIFEFILIQTIVLEITFGFVLGWPKTLPFLIISILNLGIWLLHLTHRRTELTVG